MDSIQSFSELVRSKIVSHDFRPICIEAEVMMMAQRRYDNSEKGKAKHRRWRNSEAGHVSDLRRGKRYRDKNRDNPEYRQRRRDTSKKCYWKKRHDALWLLFTFEP